MDTASAALADADGRYASLRKRVGLETDQIVGPCKGPQLLRYLPRTLLRVVSSHASITRLASLSPSSISQRSW